MTVLWPGDELVVVRDYELRVDNDDYAVATAAVARVVSEPFPALSPGEQSGRPR